MNRLSKAVGQNRRVVLGHDWLTGMRGGERVLEVLCDSFPDAPIITLLHKAEAISTCINRHAVHSSWLNRVPGIARHYRNWLPLLPAVSKSVKAPDGDLLVTCSHCVAKSFRKATDMRHLCYCFTPMRYAWTFFDEYFGRSHAKAILVRPLLAALRRWDRKTAEDVDRFVAISKHVQKRIQAFYGRKSDVVYPPVDIARWTPDAAVEPEAFDLVVSALVPYKKIDLAVRAYNASGRSLKVVGVGSGASALRGMAAPNISFLGWQSDEAILDLYRRCRLLVFPGEEDFGIVPLEAQACGRPVVAFGRGGVQETVVDDLSGVFFEDQEPEALNEAVSRAADKRWDPQAIRAHAKMFGVQRFIEGLSRSVSATLDSGTGRL